MSGKRHPACGTWDFTEDAHEVLQQSGEAYVLATGMEGSRISRIRVGHVTTLEGVEWFRWRLNHALDSIAEDIRRRGEG